MRKKFLLLGAFVAISYAPAALAQAASPVELKGDVKLDKIVVQNGKEQHQLTEPKVVVPGDRLIFSTAYHNTGAMVVKNFVVTNPIPQGVTLASDATGNLEVSVDDGKNWGLLAMLTVPDGQGGRRPAQASDATHVRWTLATLAAGASGVLTYNAIVR